MGFFDSIGKVVGKVANFIPGVNLVSSALDLGMGMFTADRANEQAQANSALQWERTYGAYKRRYQDTSADMKAAGLNPILAASGGFNVGSGPQAALPQVHQASVPPPSSTALSVARTGEAKSNIQKNLRQSKLLNQQAKTEITKRANMRAQAGLMNQQEKESVQKVSNLIGEWEKIREESILIANKRNLTVQEILNARQKYKQLKAITDRMRTELAKVKDISKVYENPGGQVLAYISEILGALGSLLKGGYKSTIINQGVQ